MLIKKRANIVPFKNDTTKTREQLVPRPLKIQPVSEFVTARQKADIEQLRLRQDQLIADKYRPLSIGVSMLLPTVGSWLLMSSGGMLEDVWKN